MPLWKALMLLNDEGKVSTQSTWLWSILPRTFACDGSCNRRTDPTSMSVARASIYIRFPDKVCNRRVPQFSLDYHLRCLFPSCFCIIMICDSAQDKRCSDSSKAVTHHPKLLVKLRTECEEKLSTPQGPETVLLCMGN